MTQPLPAPTLLKFAKMVFSPLKNTDCATCFFVAGGGKRTLVPYLLNDESVLRQIIGKKYDDYIFVFVNTDELLDLSNISYLKLIHTKISQALYTHKIKKTQNGYNVDNPLYAIEADIRMLILKNKKLLLILNDFEQTLLMDPTIYANLERIMAIDKSRITYIFISSVNMLHESLLSKLVNLKYALSQNVIYWPILGKEDAYYIMDSIAAKTGCTINVEVKQALYEYCGGHPQLLKYSLNFLCMEEGLAEGKKDQIVKFLLTNPQINYICMDIWNSFNTSTQEALVQALTSVTIQKEYQDEVEFLEKMKIITKEGKTYGLFCKLFYQYVIGSLPKQKLTYDPATQTVAIGAKVCLDVFTPQEIRVIAYFLKHSGKVITRDAIAEAIWKEESFDKYSDWMIDKMISNIRKKLQAEGFDPNKLATLKKRGFYFSQ